MNNPSNPSPLRHLPPPPNTVDTLSQLSRRIQARLVYDAPRRIGGEDHRPLFQASVQLLPHGYSATGSGTSKMGARRAAAGAMIDLLKSHHIRPSQPSPPPARSDPAVPCRTQSQPQPQLYPQKHSQPQLQIQSRPQPNPQPQLQLQLQPQPRLQPPQQPQSRSQSQPLFFVDREPDPALELEVNASAKAPPENATAPIQPLELLSKTDVVPRVSPSSVTQSAPSHPLPHPRRDYAAHESDNVYAPRGPSVSSVQPLPPVKRRSLSTLQNPTVGPQSVAQSTAMQSLGGHCPSGPSPLDKREAFVMDESVTSKPWQKAGGISPFMPTKPRVVVPLSKPMQVAAPQMALAERSPALTVKSKDEVEHKLIREPTVVDKHAGSSPAMLMQRSNGNGQIAANGGIVASHAATISSSRQRPSPKIVPPCTTQPRSHEGKKTQSGTLEPQLLAVAPEMSAKLQASDAAEANQNATKGPFPMPAPGSAKLSIVPEIDATELEEGEEMEGAPDNVPISKPLADHGLETKGASETQSQMMGQMRVTILQLTGHAAPTSEGSNSHALIRSSHPPKKWRAEDGGDKIKTTQMAHTKQHRASTPHLYSNQIDAATEVTSEGNVVPLRKRARPIVEARPEHSAEELACRLRLTLVGDIDVPWVREQIQKLIAANLFVELWLVVGGATEASGECVKGVSRFAITGTSMAVATAYEIGKRWQRLWVDRAQHLADGGIPALCPRVIILCDDPMLSFLKQEGVVDIVNKTGNDLAGLVQTFLHTAKDDLLRSQ